MVKMVTQMDDALGMLEQMTSPELRESLCRRMLVSGGTVLRDEAIMRAPTGADNHSRNIEWKDGYTATIRHGHATWGKLKDAIYLAYDPGKSTDTVFRYTVSFNRETAPQGIWLEFGYMMEFVRYKDKEGNWHTDERRKLANPRFMPADPFLAPAFDSKVKASIEAMQDRARVEFPKLMAGGDNDV